MIISLIGYRGSGKTSLAPLLAEFLGWDWIDADRELELRAGLSIAEIFAQEGEARFRQLETELLAELAARERLVLATGGGAVLNPETRRRLREAGPVIWLQVDAETVAERLQQDADNSSRSRPALTTLSFREEIAAVLTEREPIYQQSAHYAVDARQASPPEILQELVGALPELQAPFEGKSA